MFDNGLTKREESIVVKYAILLFVVLMCATMVVVFFPRDLDIDYVKYTTASNIVHSTPTQFKKEKTEADNYVEELEENVAPHLKNEGVSLEGIPFIEYEAPTGKIREQNVKTMMGKHKLGKTTPRRKMMEGVDGGCSSEGYGVATVEGRYCIALGTGFCSEIGTYIDVVLEDGTTLPCILGDQKADEHTNPTDTEYGNAHTYHRIDSSVVEFILYTDNNTGYDGWKQLTGKKIGSMCQFDGLKSPVDKIIVYKQRYDFSKVGLSESQVW